MNRRRPTVALAGLGGCLLALATGLANAQIRELPNPVSGPFVDDGQRRDADRPSTYAGFSGWTRDTDGDSRPDRFYCCDGITPPVIHQLAPDGELLGEVHKDRDGNGYYEYVEFDTGGDGSVDMAIIDVGEDGSWNVYGWAPDAETGKATQYAIDNDGDRRSDVRGVDTNGDGELDVRGEDPDGDGFFNEIDVDTDHDGGYDVHLVDTNGDQRPDERWTYGDDQGPASFDRDFDGTDDEFWEDTDGDGSVDQVRVDADHDGTIDTTYRDVDRDGRLEQVDLTDDEGRSELRTDRDGDGKWDVYARDLDGDGTYETESYDRDGDGERDSGAWARDTDGDGRVDTRFEDTNGDGQADKITASDTDGSPTAGSPIEYDRMGDGSFEQRREDVDGNGVYDTLYIDLDGDGTYETTVYDTDENGIFEVMERDRDGDGFVDDWSIDTDGDGHFDTWERDQDGDGRPEVFSYDRDGDGERDRGNWFIDTDGDGVPDLEARDTDGDGLADEVTELPDLDDNSDNDGAGDGEYFTCADVRSALDGLPLTPVDHGRVSTEQGFPAGDETWDCYFAFTEFPDRHHCFEFDREGGAARAFDGLEVHLHPFSGTASEAAEFAEQRVATSSFRTLINSGWPHDFTFDAGVRGLEIWSEPHEIPEHGELLGAEADIRTYNKLALAAAFEGRGSYHVVEVITSYANTGPTTVTLEFDASNTGPPPEDFTPYEQCLKDNSALTAAALKYEERYTDHEGVQQWFYMVASPIVAQGLPSWAAQRSLATDALLAIMDRGVETANDSSAEELVEPQRPSSSTRHSQSG
ncbi:MAG: hypothetical protein CL424_20380 [Acidimicrobiaceae bacterium]|nr:hypothetical protein [Acidimicrobiaceae bacterium]